MTKFDAPTQGPNGQWSHHDGITVNEYQRRTGNTAVYPGAETPDGFDYVLFGLVGEAGELANKRKKILRKEENLYAHREVLADELGDVLWYAARVAKELGYTLEEIAQMNLQKLAARHATGTIKDHK